MKMVQVYVRGGLVQDLLVPAGVEVEVFDYDVEGLPEEDCCTCRDAADTTNDPHSHSGQAGPKE
jgi:hypothetical protein